jgi:putative membrane protein
MRRYRKIIVTFFLPVAALLGGAALSNGCAHDNNLKRPTEESYGQAQDDEQRTAVRTISAEPISTGVTPQAYGVNEMTQAADGPVIDPASAEKLTNDKIIKVAHVANEGEMEQAALAVRRGSDPRVRAFANQMLTDHKMADMKGERVASTDSLKPTDSATSDLLRRNAHKTMEELSQLRGNDLDRAYISAQVEEHSAVLQLIDDRLIPQATDQNVKNVLQEIRPAVARHLEQALTLQTQLKDKN